MSETHTEIFKPEARSISTIFRNADSYYQIPDYQRPYSWGDEEVEQLWEDLNSAVESANETYFLGPLILVHGSVKGSYDVIDGQQRLTTLMILFCVLRDFYGEAIEKIDPQLIKKLKDAIKSSVEDRPRLRLITQIHKENQFEAEIINRVDDQEILRLAKAKNNMKSKKMMTEKFVNTAFIFKQSLDELNTKDGLDGIKKFTDYLLEKVQMITITCSKPEYAIKLFQVLNARGLDLSPADLIKSELYSKLRGDTQQKQFNATWNEVETLSKGLNETLTDLWTYYEYYLLGQNPKKSIYEELKRIFEKKDANDIIFDFKKFVECYVEIYQTESKLIYAFFYLPTQVFWKAILTTAKIKKYSDYSGLCKELRRLYYSYWIAGYTTSKTKQLSFDMIRMLKEGKSLKDIQKKVEDKIKEHSIVSRMKENLQGEAYGSSWLKPLLILIEYEQTDDSKQPFIEMDNKLHVDHILPEGWAKFREWSQVWTDDHATTCLQRLGNLTLLSDKKNMAQHNDPPNKKAEMYKNGHGGKTAFEISKKIIKILSNNDWTEKTLNKRQKWLIEQIDNILA